MLEVALSEFARAHAEGAAVVDVREPHEYARGHVPGAHLVPLSQLRARINELPEGSPLYFICATGSRSLAAARHLAALGRPALSVRSGTMGWVMSGREVSAGPPSRPADLVEPSLT